jgi:hypothetical protein
MVQHVQIGKYNIACKQKKGRNHLIISTDAEKAFYKIQHPFMIKDLKKVGIKSSHLYRTKAIYDS